MFEASGGSPTFGAWANAGARKTGVSASASRLRVMAFLHTDMPLFHVMYRKNQMASNAGPRRREPTGGSARSDFNVR
jgi:hypothetical protein